MGKIGHQNDLHRLETNVAGVEASDREEALEFKEMGNDFFRQWSYSEASKHYTLSHCPHNKEKPEDPINKGYSIILANRSAALDGARA